MNLRTRFLPSQTNVIMLLLEHSGVQHTLPTINFNPDIKLKVNVSLRGGASDTPVGGCCWPALGEQLVHSSKARGFLARGAPAQAQVGGRYQQDIYLSRGYKAFPNYVHTQCIIL